MTEVRKNRIFSLAVFVVTVLWFSIFAVARLDMHHDAVMLKPAIDVAAGKVIFRDTFCQYGALAVWIQALAVKLFGGELIVIQLLTVLFYGGIGVLSDVVFRRFLSWPFRIVNLVLFWFMAPFYIVPFHPWSSVYALFFMLLSTEFLLRFIEKERPWSAALAGAFAACAFLARHPCGVVMMAMDLLVLGFCWYSFKSRWRGVAYCAGGAAAVLGVFSLYLTVTGAWYDYLRQCFGFVLGFAVERGGNLVWREIAKRFFPLDGVLWIVDLLYPVMPFLCVATALKEFCGFSKCDEEERRGRLRYFAVAVLGVVSWHQYYPVSCLRHLYWAGIPMFGVFTLVCERLWRQRDWHRAAAAALLLLGAVPVVFRIWYGAVPFLNDYGGRRSIDLPGVRHLRLSGTEIELVKGIYDTYRDLPPEIRARGVFNYTPDAVLSVMLPETKFKHAMFVNWKDDVYVDYPAKAMAYILTNRPPVISQRPFFRPGCSMTATGIVLATDPEPFTLPEYDLVFCGDLYGLRYFFYSPLD